jgi:hypothetical protein
MLKLGVLESKWDPIRKKLVRRLLEEQDKVLRSYFAQKGGRVARGETGAIARAGNMSNGTCMREDGARRPWPSDQILIKWGAWKLGFLFWSIIFFGFVKCTKFVVN